MARYPKLLPQIEITTSCDTFGYTLGGIARTAVLDLATYDSIIEVLRNLRTKLQAISATFDVSVSYRGFVSITNSVAWTVNWGTTDNGLRDLLGYDGTEVVVLFGATHVLTASDRHLRGWYSPVPVEYPGRRRRLARRLQETDDGDVSIVASLSTHKYLDLLFDACLEPQLEADMETTAEDGYGYSIDWTDRTYSEWWEYVADITFRYYEDADLGTVDTPGTEGVDYHTCRRMDEELEFAQVDPDGYTYFSVRLPMKVVGA